MCKMKSDIHVRREIENDVSKDVYRCSTRRNYLDKMVGKMATLPYHHPG